MSYTNGLDNPAQYFNTLLYAGNSSTNHSITGVGFQPDWVWIKERDASNHHIFVDSVRGATKYLLGNDPQAEVTSSNYVSSLDSDGFTLGSDPGVNRGSMVSWNWLAGTSVSGNSGGSGTAKAYSGSVNTTSGFSIIKYIGNATDGQTIPHHLGVTPAVVIVKNIDATSGDRNWSFLHKIHFGTNNHLYLNLTNATDSNANRFSGTAPTASNFTLGGADAVNKNDSDHIAYCLAEKQGYSKFGSYTGNGNADGAFVYTGFKPAWLIIKRTDSSDGWIIFDNKRSSFNVVDKNVQANSDNTETDYDYLDFLSNGFKIRMNGASANGSGASYIYMAFAESPFVNSNGIPNNAR